MKKNRKGFTTVELVIVIAVIAVLAAVLIPTFASLIRKAEESVYLQEKTNQMILDMQEKVLNEDYMTWEEFEELLDKKLSELQENGLTADEIEALINAAIQNYLDKLNGGDVGLSEDQINKIIQNALKDLDTGLSKEEIEEIISNALANQQPVPPAEKPTEAPAEPTINSPEDFGNILGADSLTGELAAGEYNIVLGADLNWSAETLGIFINDGANVVIDLNGHTLTTTTQCIVQQGGSLTLTGGTLNTSGFVNVKGSCTIEGCTLYLSESGGSGVQNSAATANTTINNCEIIAQKSGSTFTYPISNVNGGTMTVTDTNITSDTFISIGGGSGDAALHLSNVNISNGGKMIMDSGNLSGTYTKNGESVTK